MITKTKAEVETAAPADLVAEAEAGDLVEEKVEVVPVDQGVVKAVMVAVAVDRVEEKAEVEAVALVEENNP
jgi:hypothetical protein